MAPTLQQLGSTFRNTMYDTLCGGDGSLPPSKSSFITWCMPGLPYQEGDFDFAANGLGTAPTAEAEKTMLQHAFNWAMQVDFLPDPKAAYTNDKQQGVYRNEAGLRLSELYGQILKFSKVANHELTEEQKAKLEEFRNLLRTKRKVKDILTNEEKEVTEDSPLMQIYRQKMRDFVTARLAYNAKRVAAAAASGPEGRGAVADWASNAQLYLMQARAAEEDWSSVGHRNDVDRIHAYINQVTEKSLTLWKARLQSFFDDALANATSPGQRFYYTTLAPGNFATAPGWSGYGLTHSMVDTTSHSETTSWSAGGDVAWGFWHAGGDVSSTETSFDSTMQTEDFALSYEMTQAQIIRPWFYPEFLVNKGWTLRKGEGWMFDQMPSDGALPPTGMFVGYPMQAVFVRNVTITSQAFQSAYHQYSSKFDASAQVGWGPFTLNGSYGHAESGHHFHTESDGATLRVPGMQVIAFVNHLLGKTPDPLPDLAESDFV
ncbi:hypothetical protein ABT001_29950 [Streptomyces sp. NPDC002793]|uniref:hypothetical protein n=1 Tax=Streptomyces sp. NPDC002793 TaxID=3154432 RepID=UPI0033238449